MGAKKSICLQFFHKRIRKTQMYNDKDVDFLILSPATFYILVCNLL